MFIRNSEFTLVYLCGLLRLSTIQGRANLERISRVMCGFVGHMVGLQG